MEYVQLTSFIASLRTSMSHLLNCCAIFRLELERPARSLAPNRVVSAHANNLFVKSVCLLKPQSFVWAPTLPECVIFLVLFLQVPSFISSFD
jgi:hypothetical protein